MNTRKLRGIIAERGMSQRKVAKAIGMPERTFYHKMNHGVFGTDEAIRIIHVLEIDNPAEIFLSNE